jgi:hypothetical protein
MDHHDQDSLGPFNGSYSLARSLACHGLVAPTNHIVLDRLRRAKWEKKTRQVCMTHVSQLRETSLPS